MSDLATLDPRLRPFAEQFVAQLRDHGYQVTVTRAYSSTATQRKLYRKYLAGLSPYPAAPPGHSLHEKGLAWDMVIDPPEGQEIAGHHWEAWGGQWGGRFHQSDPIHFEARQLA